ncbi:hypothetical protein PL11_009710 [Lentilactobacillus curieae]|uniref:Prepilin-type N-terminal cleavage/methylation domain-containing protein n=1 Tax=Lentilactobacillus curieae TaxID=1138822 RepID=A0A1S6QKS3_9LACO|nr:hypothetical protein [Lentilactobacillus curieae]AQW22180.1 hypothetical protein PL11_009710 [Lentilactobacillus curieae]
MKKKNRQGFTLIDSLIGITIITMFSILYFGLQHQLHEQDKYDHIRLQQARYQYENQTSYSKQSKK